MNYALFAYFDLDLIDILFEEDSFVADMMMDTMIEIFVGDYIQQHDITTYNFFPEANHIEPIFSPAPVYDTPPSRGEFEAIEQAQNITGFNDANDVRMDVISVGRNSITIDFFFNPVHDAAFNSLRMYDFTHPGNPNGGTWVPLFGEWSHGMPRIQSGRRTIGNLVPGATYIFVSSVWSWSRNSWVNAEFRVTLPGQNAPLFGVMGITQTGFTAVATFPVDGNWGNIVEIHDGTRWRDITGQGLRARSGFFTVSNLRPGFSYQLRFTYYDRNSERWGPDTRHTVQLVPVRTPSWTVTDIRTNQFTVNVVFPVEGARYNTIGLYNRRLNGGYWIIPVRNYARSGSFTFRYSNRGLEPGWTYHMRKAFYLPGVGERDARRDVTLLPGHVRFQTRDLAFYFEPEDVAANRISANNLNLWLNRMQTTHDAFYRLTGLRHWRGQRMVMQSTRYRIRDVAWAGQTILFDQGHLMEMIRRINTAGCWSFGMMHELSHNFDHRSWNFDGEFFANFKMAYVMDRYNASVYNRNGQVRTGLAAYRQMFYNGVGMSYRRVFHQPWTYNRPRYHEDALAYSFLRIQQRIGWDPFAQTFRYFYANVGYAPITNLVRINLFLTRLRDFSGVDVIGLWRPHELHYYGLHFGGTIRYI